MFDIVSLGEILIDFTPNGQNAHGAALFARNPGGAPANVLAMNAKLGGRSAFIGKVGNDAFGDFLKKTLESYAIDTSGLRKDPHVPTTLAFVQLDSSGDRSFTFYRNPGADVCLQESEVQTDLIDACRIFHFGSLSLTDEPCRSAALFACRYAKAQGKLISFDPNYRPALWRSVQEAKTWMEAGVAQADLLKVSEEELLLLTGEEDPRRGAALLLGRGVKAVFVTMGARGAFYRNASHEAFVPAPRVHAIDTTGAGDAFWGALLWKLCRLSPDEISTADLRAEVAFANAAGSLTTTRPGAIPALPSGDEIARCLNEWT